MPTELQGLLRSTDVVLLARLRLTRALRWPRPLTPRICYVGMPCVACAHPPSVRGGGGNGGVWDSCVQLASARAAVRCTNHPRQSLCSPEGGQQRAGRNLARSASCGSEESEMGAGGRRWMGSPPPRALVVLCAHTLYVPSLHGDGAVRALSRRWLAATP